MCVLQTLFYLGHVSLLPKLVPPCYILFWDRSDIELKASEDCVRAEENDGIYFRIYTEELVLSFPGSGALCIESLKEHVIVLLQATLYSW